MWDGDEEVGSRKSEVGSYKLEAMPYRSIFITLVTVTITLLIAGMWVRSITPMLARVNASTQPSTMPGNSHPGLSAAAATQMDRPDRQFKDLVKAVLIATFVIVGLIFAIGFFATMRAWVRSPGKHKKTRYVDAWKLAGERLQPKDEEGEGDRGKGKE
jgi:hypothetical protein